MRICVAQGYVEYCERYKKPLYNTIALIILMYPSASWYYQLHIWSKNKILMPSTTNHSYVKYKSIYSIYKNENLHKKVAYQQL